MDHFIHIYRNRAPEYHRLIAAEDVNGNLLHALQAAVPLSDASVLDVGTGTGRLPLLLHHQAGRIAGLDLHAAMLRQNQAQRSAALGRWGLVQGDMGHLPFPASSWKVTLAGWAIGHFCAWFAPDWKTPVGRVLSEMQRITVPGGWNVIFETLGTGSPQPAAPTAELNAYYDWLESDWGYERHILRTDYHFATVEQAVETTEFFFGSELAGQIRQQGWSRLREWTGMWVRRLEKP